MRLNSLSGFGFHMHMWDWFFIKAVIAVSEVQLGSRPFAFGLLPN
jgi:hypothetical protein